MINTEALPRNRVPISSCKTYPPEPPAPTAAASATATAAASTATAAASAAGLHCVDLVSCGAAVAAAVHRGARAAFLRR